MLEDAYDGNLKYYNKIEPFMKTPPSDRLEAEKVGMTMREAEEFKKEKTKELSDFVKTGKLKGIGLAFEGDPSDAVKIESVTIDTAYVTQSRVTVSAKIKAVAKHDITYTASDKNTVYALFLDG